MAIKPFKPRSYPRTRDRFGPGGMMLDEDEALAYFPDIDQAPEPFLGEISPSHVVHLKADGLDFTLNEIELSREPGVYFGVVVERLRENRWCLYADQCIGFEARHVFAVSDAAQFMAKVAAEQAADDAEGARENEAEIRRHLTYFQSKGYDRDRIFDAFGGCIEMPEIDAFIASAG